MFCCNVDMPSNLKSPPFFMTTCSLLKFCEKHHDVGRDLPLFFFFFLTDFVYIAPVTKGDIVNVTLRKKAELCIPKVLYLHTFRKWIYLAGILFIQPRFWHMPEYRG